MHILALLLLFYLPATLFGQSLAELEKIRDELSLSKTQLESTLQDVEQKLRAINKKIRIQKDQEQGEFTDTGYRAFLPLGEIEMKQYPDRTAPILAMVTRSDRVYLQAYAEGFYEVSTAQGKGFIHERDLNSTFNDGSEMARIREIPSSSAKQYFAHQQQQAQHQTDQAAQERRKTLEKQYSGSTLEKIVEKRIWIGMTTQMARDSWGDPQDINRTVRASGVNEQWVYGYGRNVAYVYFENGTLTSWQD